MYVDNQGNHMPHYDDAELMSIVDIYQSSDQAIFERRNTSQCLFNYNHNAKDEIEDETDEQFEKRMDDLMKSKYFSDLG